MSWQNAIIGGSRSMGEQIKCNFQRALIHPIPPPLPRTQTPGSVGARWELAPFGVSSAYFSSPYCPRAGNRGLIGVLSAARSKRIRLTHGAATHAGHDRREQLSRARGGRSRPAGREREEGIGPGMRKHGSADGEKGGRCRLLMLLLLLLLPPLLRLLLLLLEPDGRAGCF